MMLFLQILISCLCVAGCICLGFLCGVGVAYLFKAFVSYVGDYISKRR